METQIFTVTQLNYSVRNMLEMEFGHIWLMGEISNLSKPVSGHWYLTLKDEQAQVRCAMFRMKNMRVNFPVQNGMQVLVRASVSLYEPRGDYQVIIESMQPAGDGLLQQQFEQLKLKLAAEGLFSQAHKKALPAFVKRVGVVTSSSGAALQDILQILKRRDPSLSVVIYPTLVQGKEAAQEIVQMIELANLRQECDVLIVGRGGGSLEDLWCFNEESVAYAIFRSQIPIISAVGHETDVTIADFVADVRAPTPSAAAELVSRDSQELVQRLRQQLDRAGFAFDRLWSEKNDAFERLCLRLNAHHPARRLALQQQQLSQLDGRLRRAIGQWFRLKSTALEQLNRRLAPQHPSRQLAQQTQRLLQSEKRLAYQADQLLLRKKQRWDRAVQRLLHNPLPQQITRHRHNMQRWEQQIAFAIQQQFARQQQVFHRCCVQLDGLSPLKILARGYSVTQDQSGKALLHSNQVNVGDQICTRLNEGEIVSRVVALK